MVRRNHRTSQALDALGNAGPLRDAVRWNAGAYLWFSGLSETLDAGVTRAEASLQDGSAMNGLDQLRGWRSSVSIR